MSVFANGNLRRAGIIFKEESLDTPDAKSNKLDLVELKMRNQNDSEDNFIRK